MRGQRVGGAINLLAAVLVTAGLLSIAARGAGPLPPLGPAFNPGTGVWTAGADARLPRAEARHLAGLDRPAAVTFERNGTAHIVAATNHDLFVALGYLHARFRLFQMDLLRRQGEGLLSEVVGTAALASDTFEDQLGLARTARAEWAAMPASSPARLALLAYAQGVNARITEDERTSNLPLLFKLLGYHPRPWTPVDTLVVQGDMVQSLDLTSDPLDYALLAQSLGYRRTMQWFPVLPPNAQHPYDPGPYSRQGAAPITAQQGSAAGARAIAAAAAQLAALPATALHHAADSNNWAVDGSKTASGKPLLAGDPHLSQTLPAIWYQVAADAPGYHFSGVSIPGTPVILIGHNRHISWSLSDTQNQATLFYLEKTARGQPDRYFWNGSWRRMGRITYDIPLKGGSVTHLVVKTTVHGPIIADDRAHGQTVAVDWVGARPSDDMDSMLGVIRAATFTQFRAALRSWHAPTQNFVYADDRGNIGLIAAGYYPLVKSGAPWLPLPGTGASDIVGTIPFADVPQVYDPPGHIVFSANQRPVGPTYPYYIGTSKDFFANGYRANRIAAVLQRGSRLTARDMERLQNDTHDYLAGLIVPRLLAALQGRHLTVRQDAARALLQAWDGTMGVGSPVASVWWTFWTQYLHDTFQPWWDAARVPAGRFPTLAVDPAQAALDEDLETWTLHDPHNAAFSPPHGAHRAAPAVMAQAFIETVSLLARSLGPIPSTWRWGRLHTRQFDSLAQVASLGYGPQPSSGDEWTVDAADEYPVSTSGPSWRFIMDWGTGRSEGIYPGGQSENPLSPWYENGIAPWWDGRYNPMLDGAAARAQPGSVTWTLAP